MARITFSLPDELANAAERRAKSECRSLSSHIAQLVERDARNAGFFPQDKTQQLLAAAKAVGVDRALAAVTKLSHSTKSKTML